MQLVKHRYRTWILALAVAAIFSGAAHAGDMAQFMPADTVIYAGWADWAQPDSAEMRFTERVLSKLRNIPELQGKGDESLARLLLDVIVPLQTGSVGVGLFNLELGDRDPVVEAALVANSGAGNERLMAAVQRFLQDVESSDDIRDRNIGGAALKSVSPPHEDIEFFWGIHKGHFILTISEAAAEKVVACLNGTAPTLANSAEVKLARGKVQAHSDQTHFCVFVNVQPAIGWVKKILAGEMGGIPPEMETVLEELGINSLKSKYVQIEKIDGVPRMGAFAHIEGELKGIFSLWKQQPVTKDDLQYIPKDAYWAQVNNLNLAGVWAEALRIIDSVNPDLGPQIQGGMWVTGFKRWHFASFDPRMPPSHRLLIIPVLRDDEMIARIESAVLEAEAEAVELQQRIERMVA